MKIRHIGIKELRQQLFKVARDVQQKKAEYVVMRNNKPVFAVSPLVFDEDDYYTPADIASIERGMDDLRHGRVYTPEQVRRDLEKHWATQSNTRRKRKKTSRGSTRR